MDYSAKGCVRLFNALSLFESIFKVHSDDVRERNGHVDDAVPPCAVRGLKHERVVCVFRPEHGSEQRDDGGCSNKENVGVDRDFRERWVGVRRGRKHLAGHQGCEQAEPDPEPRRRRVVYMVRCGRDCQRWQCPVSALGFCFDELFCDEDDNGRRLQSAVVQVHGVRHGPARCVALRDIRAGKFWRNAFRANATRRTLPRCTSCIKHR